MDNQELFLCVPGIPHDGIIYHSTISILRSRREVCNILNSAKINKWIDGPKIYTFPGLQEVCDAEISLLITDDDA